MWDRSVNGYVAFFELDQVEIANIADKKGFRLLQSQ